VYAHAFQTLSEVLGKQSLLALPASVQATSDGLSDIRGPLRTGSTLSENLQLEYAEGMTGKDLGWGRLDASRLHEIMAIHTAYADLARRTPYLASVQGSNLLDHILLSMDQAVSGKPVAGALGKASDRVLILAGHDTNISHISGLLNLSWLLPGYQRDDTPPGGSLVFRLWRGPDPKAYSVDMLYIAQTLDQLRNASPLGHNSAPAIAPIFVPGCKRTECDWENFRHIVSVAIDPQHTLQ
jgi:4-phytase/acid phosphatase